jgi:DNA polymerase-3 subunit gamma/tau
VGRASPFARTYLLEAHPVSFAKNIFTIGFDPEFEDHIGLVDNARNHTLLQTKLGELGHANAQIKFVKAERPADWAGQPAETAPEPEAPPPATAKTKAAPAAGQTKERPAPAKFNKDDFKNDPLIQKALEIFKGQIVEVRT